MLPKVLQEIVNDYIGKEYDPQCVIHTFERSTLALFVTDECNKTWLFFPYRLELFCLETFECETCEMVDEFFYYCQLASGTLYTVQNDNNGTYITYWKLFKKKLTRVHRVTLPFPDIEYAIQDTVGDIVVLQVIHHEDRDIVVVNPAWPFQSFVVVSNTMCTHAQVASDFVVLYDDDIVRCYDTDLNQITYVFQVHDSVLIDDVLCFIYDGVLNLFDFKTRRMELRRFTDMERVHMFGTYLHACNEFESEIWDLQTFRCLVRRPRMWSCMLSIGKYHLIYHNNKYELRC